MGSSVTLGGLDHPFQHGVGFALSTPGPSQPTSDQQLTQYMDRGGSGDTGHLVGGRAFPDSVLLFDEGVEDEAAVSIHLGTALPHTAHLWGMDTVMGGHHQPTPVQGRNCDITTLGTRGLGKGDVTHHPEVGLEAKSHVFFSSIEDSQAK